MKAQLALFLLFGVLGTASDQIHVQFEVLSYAAPALLGQPLWVPLLFGVAALAVVNSYGLVFHRRATDSPRPSGREMLLVSLDFVVAYFATGVFKEHPTALALGLALSWAAVVAVRPSWALVGYSLSNALGGPAFEALLSSTGAFAYHQPDVARVPIWLPGLYLHVAVLGRVVYLRYFAPVSEAGALGRGGSRTLTAH